MTINTPGRGWDDSNLHTLDSVNQNTSNEIWRTIWCEYTITSYLGENPDKEELITAIKSAIELIKKEDIYASWSEWEIYRIKIADTKGNTRDLLVAKKRFDNNPDNEYTLHDRIWKLVKDWDPVKVPVLRWKFSHEGEEYIVMDFIKWKTLYHKIAEWIIEAKAKQIEASAAWKTETEKNIAYQEAYNLRNRIKSAKSDSDIDHIFLEWYKYDTKKTDESFDRKKLKVQIFWSEEWKKIKKELWDFIEKIHKAWFYHRDLHEKNIIFWDDGKIYVIDFWKAFFKDPKEWKPSDTEVYVIDMWEQEWVYVRDGEILSIISKMTKTKDDEEWEELAKQRIEEAKKLTKGAMVIEWLDFKKIKSKKILNRIKKYFWSYEQLKKKVEKEDKWKYTVDSFIWVSDEDFILTLFSITRENLESILTEEIPATKDRLLNKIKDKRSFKLWKQSWVHLFWEDDEVIDISFLSNVLKQIDNKTGYEEIYKNRWLSYSSDLLPMIENTKRLLKIEEVKWYLEEIYNAII